MRIILLAAVCVLFHAPLHAQPPAALQHDQQRLIKEDTERFIRRLETMLRVMDYYQLSQGDRKAVLEEATVCLDGLTREQMTAVMQHLETAARLDDPAKSEKEIEAAYDKHREVVVALQALLARQDALKGLDQAADRLERMAQDQFERYVQTAEMLHDADDILRNRPADPGAKKRKRNINITTSFRIQADHQVDLGSALQLLVKQVAALHPNLNSDQKERVARWNDAIAKLDVLRTIEHSSTRLRATGYPDKRIVEWKAGNGLQFRIAGDLKDLVHLLKATPDPLPALRAAQAQLDRVIAQQGDIAKETQKQQETAADKDKHLDAARALGLQQDRTEFDTRDLANLLKAPLAGKAPAKEPAEQVAAAQAAMNKSSAALQENAPEKARPEQDAALAELEKARRGIDDMIAQLEKAKSGIAKVDAAAAAQHLASAIQQTQQAAQQSAQAAQAQPPGEPGLAEMQQQVADAAGQMKLDDAQKPAAQAADALQKGDLAKAVAAQQQALAKLQQAAAAPMNGQPMAGQPMQAGAQPMGKPAGQVPQPGQAKGGKPMNGQAKPAQSQQGKPAAGQPSAGAKPGQAPAAQAKSGQAKAGQATAKSGQPGQSKSQGATPGTPGQTPGQLAQTQQAILTATKAMMASQQSTQGAMAALGQAQAQAPANAQGSLQQAAQQLAQAGQQLSQGNPAGANQSQGQALASMQKALGAMSAALAGKTPGQGPPGQGQGQGQGQAPGQGQGQGLGMGQKPSPGAEKNQGQGTGNRLADGKVSNAPSQLVDVAGDGSFLHLPPRQRELIQQAITGHLPPEYAAFIQQYYQNIARGRAAAPALAGPR